MKKSRSRINRRRFLQGAVLIPVATLTEALPETSSEAWLLGCPVGQATAVRFFYNPEWADYFHFPLVFRVVRAGDSRLNTAPMRPEGRTAYITHEDMKDMLRALAQSGTSWTMSSKVEPLDDFHKMVRHLGPGPPALHIWVVCLKGTALGKIQPARICNTLAPMDSALKSPRALWEFQALRFNYGCKVPGFKVGADPESR